MKRIVLCFMFVLPILASARHIVLHNNTSKTLSVKMKERGFPIQTGSLSASGSRQFSLLGNSSGVVLMRLGDAAGRLVITRNIMRLDKQFIIQLKTYPVSLSSCVPDDSGNYDCALSG